MTTDYQKHFSHNLGVNFMKIPIRYFSKILIYLLFSPKILLLGKNVRLSFRKRRTRRTGRGRRTCTGTWARRRLARRRTRRVVEVAVAAEVVEAEGRGNKPPEIVMHLELLMFVIHKKNFF